jgi:hypothetical protein
MNLNRLAEWDGTKWIESDPNEPIVGILRIRTVSGKWVKLDLTEKDAKAFGFTVTPEEEP